MTPREIQSIIDEGEPETMRETLRQILDERGPNDPIYSAMVEAWRLTPGQADLLHLLWRYKGEVLGWERLTASLGYGTERDLQQGALRHLRPRLLKRGAPIEIKTVYGFGLKLVQTGPVPWEGK